MFTVFESIVIAYGFLALLMILVNRACDEWDVFNPTVIPVTLQQLQRIIASSAMVWIVTCFVNLFLLFRYDSIYLAFSQLRTVRHAISSLESAAMFLVLLSSLIWCGTLFFGMYQAAIHDLRVNKKAR
ncbi:hypothetical protein ACYB9R_01210 [Alcaligenes aquatilis]|uniref:hypothetical protein n=1 Tax=Alcaligenes aquatilis TaxID=323284 RepID=UPI002AA8622A|nr:hypothetical protein [Alcaligenes faecalis]